MPKSAADIAHVEFEQLFRDLAVRRNLFAQRGDALHAQVERVLAVYRVVSDETGARFHRTGRDASDVNLEACDVRCHGKCFFNILRIARLGFQRQITRNIFMQPWRIRRQRFFRSHHAWQITVFNLDQIGSVLRRRGAGGHDQCQRLAHKSHLAVRQRRAQGCERLSTIDPGKPQRMGHARVAGIDCVHAGKNMRYARIFDGVLDVYRKNMRVRAVCTQKITIQLPWRVPVGSKLAASRNEPHILYAVAAHGVLILSVQGVYSG